MSAPTGSPGDQRRRFWRHHVPLAAACALALVAFMSVPAFDPRTYPSMEMRDASAPSASTAPGAHGGQPSPSGHAAQGSSDHPSTRSTPADHTASQPPSAERTHATDDRVSVARLTTATGYIATGLLAITLVIGPASLVLRRRTPVSSYLRRDVGMWTAILSVVHVFFGLQVHSGGQLSGIVRYFLAADGSPLLTAFGLGNWTGLAATVIVLALLAISSDLALRTLKAGRWKWLQRLNYALFGLVLAHALFYGAFLRTTSPYTWLLVIIAIAVLAGQVAGIWLWRRRRSRAAAVPA